LTVMSGLAASKFLISSSIAWTRVSNWYCQYCISTACAAAPVTRPLTPAKRPASITRLSIRIPPCGARPLLVELHRALSRLSSVLTVMHTGAHPDDEQSGMLAAMHFGMGMRTVVACSTRGEGGQNSLGPERTGALGVVRTREMEEARSEERR